MNRIIFKSILNGLEGEPSSGKKLLDASCASGKSTQVYRDFGYIVTPTSYNPRSFKIKDMTCLQVDLNEQWPFSNAEFDVIVLQEVIEHLENIPLVFREVKRLLKPNGIFIFSTPNMLNWVSRLTYLGTGFYRGRKKPIDVSRPPGNAPNWHVLPFHIYHWLCYQYKLKIERIFGVGKRWHCFVVGLWIHPIAALCTYIWWITTEKDERQRAYNLDLWRYLNSKELLLSKNIVVKVRNIEEE